MATDERDRSLGLGWYSPRRPEDLLAGDWEVLTTERLAVFQAQATELEEAAMAEWEDDDDAA